MRLALPFAACAAALLTFSAQAQPQFGNPSPTAGSSTSQAANAAADQAAYRDVDYTNKAVKGPALIVIPGEIKSNNASFTQKFSGNNIADFAELELTKANFSVLNRSNLGPMLNEISLAYNMGDANEARKAMRFGKLKTTKWIMKFDITKAEQVSENKKGFDGRAIGALGGLFGMGGAVAGHVVSNVQTNETTGMWLVGMQYKIMNAETTEVVATNYKELRMEVGATNTSVMGVSNGASGGVGMDTMVQRLVQTAVWEIDKNNK